MYGEALALYAGSDLTKVEICRRCGVSLGGFSRYIRTYHRDLMLRRGGLERGSREALGEGLGQRTGQRRDTRARYREAVEACDSMEYIACNVSEIAREFGLDGSGLGRQLRTHYPGVIERREEARERLGLGDGLPRGMRPGAGSNMPRRWSCCVPTVISRCRRLPPVATSPIPAWSSICFYITGSWSTTV